VTSFTAANTVPASNVGSSLQSKDISQLAPSQCAGMNLTSIVVVSGTSFAGTPANELILGRTYAGTLNVNGGGGNDCIVMGGDATTTNAIDGGGGTDVCVGGPSAKKNTFGHCETTY
jgi:hypothetical protein